MSTTNALAGSAPTDPEDHILVLRARSGDRAALSADFERSFDPRASRQRSIRFYIEQSRRWYPTVQPSCQTRRTQWEDLFRIRITRVLLIRPVRSCSLAP
jgi:hypothetical protein